MSRRPCAVSVSKRMVKVQHNGITRPNGCNERLLMYWYAGRIEPNHDEEDAVCATGSPSGSAIGSYKNSLIMGAYKHAMKPSLCTVVKGPCQCAVKGHDTRHPCDDEQSRYLRCHESMVMTGKRIARVTDRVTCYTILPVLSDDHDARHMAVPHR